jgi:membrane protein implicated in regulation of membrane protease activity
MVTYPHRQRAGACGGCHYLSDATLPALAYADGAGMGGLAAPAALWLLVYVVAAVVVVIGIVFLVRYTRRSRGRNQDNSQKMPEILAGGDATSDARTVDAQQWP